MSITVKIAQIPGALKEFALDSGSTVADALRVSEFSAENFEINVNGSRASTDQSLEDGDRITLSKAAKGN